MLSALSARVADADLAEADAHLPPGARSLFRRTPHDGQAHALRVLRELKRAGEAHPSLLAAALLHDAGKSAARITPLIRSLFVVFKRLAPGRLQKLEAVGWRKPFVALRDHPSIGATWAREAGCDPMTVSLIARHQEKLDVAVLNEEARLLKALQEADDQS
jgi:hypothetical protein